MVKLKSSITDSSSSLSKTLDDIIHQLENRKNVYSFYLKNLDISKDYEECVICSMRIHEMDSFIALINRYKNS